MLGRLNHMNKIMFGFSTDNTPEIKLVSLLLLCQTLALFYTIFHVQQPQSCAPIDEKVDEEIKEIETCGLEGNKNNLSIAVDIDGGEKNEKDGDEVASLDAENNAALNELLNCAFMNAKNSHAQQLKILMYLVKAGAELDAVDSNGCTSLILAAKYGRTQYANILIDAGAALDHKDSNGNTALIWATRESNIDIVKLFCNSKANLDLVNKNGYSAFTWAQKVSLGLKGL